VSSASRTMRPSFETAAEPVIGPRFARTRWRPPQDEVRASQRSAARMHCGAGYAVVLLVPRQTPRGWSAERRYLSFVCRVLLRERGRLSALHRGVFQAPGPRSLAPQVRQPTASSSRGDPSVPRSDFRASRERGIRCPTPAGAAPGPVVETSRADALSRARQ
jgi:hypothetical protein